MESVGIVSNIAERAVNQCADGVVGAVDAICDYAGAGGANVILEIVLPITDVASSENSAGGAERSSTVGVGVREVSGRFGVGKAEQEDQCNKYLGVHIRIIQQIIIDECRSIANLRPFVIIYG